jgi:hypothetical protein
MENKGLEYVSTLRLVSISDNGDGGGLTLTRSWLHRLEVMNASKECNRALVQEGKEKKKWTDAESER